ncbi:TPA: hypothetical protein O4G03_003849 [Proteus mirabilis]|uniref:hypothetical protein n=1 Tax=Proteus mirabilis TaxID=584 RepID=UPI00200D2750|nr:hypothetical protein [Proteus mirabilis]UPW73562.1 hypothetical protein M1765_10600 [Proteus mirabilis]UPW77443.1 hypothetical protein M1766_10585 [Proteus mirabilis]HCZ8422092.1 hypothetical protein [Proteus mirabilis]HCZ8426076.1 hypothetical protein [Proteus mirabilis]HCZ8583647.1 hypothetical protein [Proteus mirabilis]
MTTEPIIIAPDGFTNEDIAKWMRDKLQCIDYLLVLYGKRERLMSDVKKLDAEITEYISKSAIQIQSK